MYLRMPTGLASLHAVDVACFTILTLWNALACEAGGVSVFIIVLLGVGGVFKGGVLVRLFYLFQFL
jgi:hypothetical protein